MWPVPFLAACGHQLRGHLNVPVRLLFLLPMYKVISSVHGGA